MKKENKKEEMRDSIRVRVHFPINYSPISGEEFSSIKDTYCAHRTSDREGLPTPFQDATDRSSMERDMEENLGSGFVRMWKLLDQKLDMIYSALTEKKLEGWTKEAVCVELGGFGLKLEEENTALKPNDRIKLKISPLTYPPFSVAVLGMVRRIEKKEDGKSRPFYEVAVGFDVINKDDQEGLFIYLFKRQREIIRSGNE